MNNTREQLETRLNILFEMLIKEEITIEKYTEIITHLTTKETIKQLF